MESLSVKKFCLLWKMTMRGPSARKRIDRRVLMDFPHKGHKAGPELQMFVKVLLGWKQNSLLSYWQFYFSEDWGCNGRNWWCSTSGQQERIGQRRRRDGHGKSGQVMADCLTANEGWIVGPARPVSKTWGKQISEIPPENPWAQMLWGKTFPTRKCEVHQKSIQATQLQPLILRAPLSLSFLHSCPFLSKKVILMRKKEGSHYRFLKGRE